MFNYSPTRSVVIAITLVTGFSLRILVQEKGVMFQENILKAAPRLNKKTVGGYRKLAGEFCAVNGELSEPRSLMNNLSVNTQC